MKLSISEVTRRNIFDSLRVRRVSWQGRLSDDDFLRRFFTDIDKIPSRDGRFDSFLGDVWQHRINNLDWSEDWIFNDHSLNLIGCDDPLFLKFLCETIHPIVREDPQEVESLVALYNEYLGHDGWELFEQTKISSRPVYSSRKIVSAVHAGLIEAHRIAEHFNSQYVSGQVTRIQEALSDGDSDLAIGSAKDFVETVCKTILVETGVSDALKYDMPQLMRATMKELSILPDQIDSKAKGADIIKRLLSNLATVADGLGELRNLYGTGHGKIGRSKGLQLRHAKLATGAACTLAIFLFDTYIEQKKK